MEFTVNKQPLARTATKGEILSSEQIDWLTDGVGVALSEAEKFFDVTFNFEDANQIAQQSIAKKDNPPPINQAILSQLYLLRSLSTDERKIKALTYIIEAYEDDGKLDILEAAVAAYKANRALKGEDNP